MHLAYHTVDVFSRNRFGGNPLAVVLGADGLSEQQMQSIAREFNYSETSFVLRPLDPAHAAAIRIFTPTVEVPFAGHPNDGTAFVLANSNVATADELVFEEKAGLVRARVERAGEHIAWVKVAAPEPFRIGCSFSSEQIANCLSLDVSDIMCDRHSPTLASVGLPFIIVEIKDRQALARARPNEAEFKKILPFDGADAMYIYCRDIDARDGAVDFTARMFAPFDHLPEDAATGSATAAACAMLTKLGLEERVHYTVAQVIEMGRPSLLVVDLQGDSVWIGGACVPVMSGTISCD